MRVAIGVDISGAVQAYTDFPKETAAEITKAIERIGRKVEREAKIDAPVDTGNLRRQITFIQSSPTGGVVLSRANYSPYVHGVPFHSSNGVRKVTPFLTSGLERSQQFIKREVDSIYPRVINRVMK